MPVISIERILSVSSEDPAHPAQNLLKTDNQKKWKCKSGEKQASVILQLKQDTIISGIDIGNENSAFVEVLVGKSCSPSADFKVLLVASTLMTLKESKDSVNTSGVRFFTKANLTQPTADEKWDRVKIVCTQPFNKHVQYGLSFVVLHSSSGLDDNDESSGSLGRFTLKEEKNDEPVTVGSWFAKRKDPPPPVPPGAAAAIRDASSPASTSKKEMKKPTPKRPKTTTPNNGVLKTPKIEATTTTPKAGPLVFQKQAPSFSMSLGDEDSPADDTDADSTYSPTKDKVSVLTDDDDVPSDSDDNGSEQTGKRQQRKKKDTNNGKVTNRQTPKRKTNGIESVKAKVGKHDQETKPFNRLLEGVTFVISGYQNPLRGELRSKACALGARYKPDWGSDCTHLICAFVNTPKFNQVRGRGKIVKKEWVEECHNRRRRLPWRRFALDRNDAGTSSEEEVWEEGSVPTTSSANSAMLQTIASGANRRRVSSDSDTEEEIERVRARQAATKRTSPKKKAADAKTVGEKNKPERQATFDDDTDMDSEGESLTANLPLPSLPDFLVNVVFYIARDIDEEERKKLHRYITAYKGSVVDDMDGNVEYVITNLPDAATEVADEFGVSSVSPDWIWACSDAGKLVPVSQFTL